MFPFAVCTHFPVYRVRSMHLFALLPFEWFHFSRFPFGWFQISKFPFEWFHFFRLPFAGCNHLSVPVCGVHPKNGFPFAVCTLFPFIPFEGFKGKNRAKSHF